MAIDKLPEAEALDKIADDMFGSINNSVSEARDLQRKKVAENVQIVVEALKKIESDIRERFDSVGNAIEKRVITIKDGRDGANGSDGKPGKDGKAGRDGAPGVKGMDGRNGSDGADGVDGVSVTNAHIDFDGSLVISLSSGVVMNVGEVVAPELAEQIKIVANGGGTSQYVLDTLASLQTQINALIPSQTGNSGKFLTTDGTATSWATVSGSGTVTSVAALTLGTTGTDLSSTVANGTTTPVITLQVPTASATNRGALSAADWTTFNSKGSGSVTSVAQSFTGGLISVAGSPITSSGTLALTVAGTSGGVPYFSSASTWATSAALTASALVIGGGAGSAPATTTTGTGVVTALGVNTGTAGAFVVNGGALGTPASGTVTNLTGTASININGTVGATTPAAGAFTTLSATGITTVAAGSAALPAIVSTTGTADTGLWFPAADTVAASTAGVERMRIDSSGYILAGATTAFDISPSGTGQFASIYASSSSGNWKLSSLSFSADTTANGLAFIKSRSATVGTNTAVVSSDALGNIIWRGADGTNYKNSAAILANVDGAVSAGIVPGRLQFLTSDTAGTLTERIRIDSSGNVGIGTSSPGFKLVVIGGAQLSGGTSAQAGLRVGVASGVATLTGINNDNSAFNPIALYTGGSEAMRIDSNGYVGIGLSSISYQLQVNTDSAGKPGVGGLWTVVSDERIKSNIVPANLDRCYEIVKSVPLKHFGFAPGVYTDEQIQDKHNLGWIAQDVQKVFKNAVSVKPFTLKTDIPDGVEEYEEQDFTLESVEKTETSIQVINGKPVQVSKVVASENKVMLFDTVDVLDEAGAVVMDGDKPLTYQMPRMVKKTKPKVRHDVIEDCLDLNSGQMIAALYGCVQALMAKVEVLETKLAAA